MHYENAFTGYLQIEINGRHAGIPKAHPWDWERANTRCS